MRAAERKPGSGPAKAAALAVCALALLLIPAAASAAPPQLWQSCEEGSGAGQCDFPRGIAADPHNGHVFVADQNNQRIDELNPLGQFIKAWGWDVVASGPGNTGSGFEICVPENGDTCKAGSEGGGSGQFGSSGPQGVALDSAGNVYVTDRANRRVQKFSPSGQFLLMFGGEVNKTKSEEVGSTEAQRNLCTAASGEVCQKGTEGTGNGQFGEWKFGSYIAVDGKGTETTADDVVYVGDQNRIQVFDSGSDYIESLPLPGQTVQSLATDSAGNLYAVYGTAVHKLSPAGVPLSPETFEIPKLAPFEVPIPVAVAVDSSGNVYAFGPTNSNVCSGCKRNPIIEFDPAANVIDEFGKEEFSNSTGLATNLCAGSEAPGNLYASNFPGASGGSFVRAYGTNPVGCFRARTLPASDVEETAAALHGSVNPSGALSSECRFKYGTTTEYGSIAPCAETPADIGSGSAPVPVHALIGSLSKGTIYHFRLQVNIKGVSEAGSDETFKTLGPPVISADETVGSAYTEATLRALVNPEGFATTYHVEYTTQAEFEVHGFTGAQSTKELNVGGDRKDHAVLANLTGLAPGTAYRWRIVVSNSSGVATGQDHGVNTYRVFAPQSDCPNQVFRTAASAPLPDCRAYEMVSPVDKNGADIISGLSGAQRPGGYVQVSSDGERITYTAIFASFAGQPNSFGFNQYLAARQAGVGWSNQGIHTPVTGRSCCEGYIFGLFPEFMAFSPDLCSAWLVDYQSPPPTPEGQEGYPNIYRRQNCGGGAGAFEALVNLSPPLPPGSKYVDLRSVQGLSADTGHAFFVARAKLNGDAAEGTKEQIYDYDRASGTLALVSVLPGGEADESGAAVGDELNLDHAVSSDGSRVYWTSEFKHGIGTVYLREHPGQGIVSGECGKATKACTVPVSSTVQEASFWTAAADGSKALYSEGEKLYEFDLGRYEAKEEASRLIASHVEGVAGASEDLSRVYFVSPEVLPGAGENSEQDEAQPGQPNLYLAEGGGFHFIATLVAGDMGFPEPGAKLSPYTLASPAPYFRPTRVSPDGTQIAFESRAPLTEYDNRGKDGRPAVEVYTYEAGGKLTCVSCNPSGARPSDIEEMPVPYNPHLFETESATKVPAAAWIPTWEHALHASNVLSADGGRLFFNANDALLPRDTNGAPDVYEWEKPGVGRCDTEDASYFPQNDGCLYLISSGESSEESEFWEASPDGRDVFFTTASSLLPQDPGSIDLYDARVNGGFPQPAENPPCEGESCQSPPAAPNDPTPASAAFRGAGNLAPKAARKSCRKGRVKKRGRCVKGHRKAAEQKRHRRDAKTNRRVGR